MSDESIIPNVETQAVVYNPKPATVNLSTNDVAGLATVVDMLKVGLAQLQICVSIMHTAWSNATRLTNNLVSVVIFHRAHREAYISACASIVTFWLACTSAITQAVDLTTLIRKARQSLPGLADDTAADGLNPVVVFSTRSKGNAINEAFMSAYKVSGFGDGRRFLGYLSDLKFARANGALTRSEVQAHVMENLGIDLSKFEQQLGKDLTDRYFNSKVLPEETANFKPLGLNFEGLRIIVDLLLLKNKARSEVSTFEWETEELMFFVDIVPKKVVDQLCLVVPSIFEVID